MFKFNGDYRDLEQVRQFYEQFTKLYNQLKEQKQYPYNALFKGKIKGIEGEDEDKAIYLLQHLKDKEEKEEYKNKMLKEGWIELTEAVVKEALDKKKKIKLSAKHTNDWATWKVEKILKPCNFNGRYGLKELRARTRGYSIHQFEDAFCQLI